MSPDYHGGSWNDAVGAASLRNTSRPLFALAGTVSNQIGFRVVRTRETANGDSNVYGRVDAADWSDFGDCLVPIRREPPAFSLDPRSERPWTRDAARPAGLIVRHSHYGAFSANTENGDDRVVQPGRAVVPHRNEGEEGTARDAVGFFDRAG